jgi:putative addiction module component (TIGR02574 family)
MSAEEIIDKATSLPVELRIQIADALLHSLNTPDPDVDREWVEITERRLDEIESGTAELIPGEEVFDRIRERFGSL